MSDETPPNPKEDGNQIPEKVLESFIKELKLPGFEKVLEEIPQAERKRVGEFFGAMIIQQTKSSFRSPIPPPAILKGYNDIIPNGAERILVMAEDQSKHRMALENTVVGGQLSDQRRGQIFAFIIGVLGLGVGATLGLTGHEWLGGAIGGTTLVSLVTAFILGRQEQKKDLEEKDS